MSNSILKEIQCLKKRVGFGEMFERVKVVTIQVQGPEFKPRNPRTHRKERGDCADVSSDLHPRGPCLEPTYYIQKKKTQQQQINILKSWVYGGQPYLSWQSTCLNAQNPVFQPQHQGNTVVSMQVVPGRKTRSSGRSQLHSKFKPTLGCMRPCLQQTEKEFILLNMSTFRTYTVNHGIYKTSNIVTEIRYLAFF